MSDRIALLAEKLERIADARKLATTTVWADAWDGIEQELLERLLRLGPDEDFPRFRLQEAMKAARHVRRVIEAGAKGEKGVRDELDILEGRKVAPIA